MRGHDEGRDALVRDIQRSIDLLDRVLEAERPDLRPDEVGRIASVGRGISRVTGLPGAGSDALLRLGAGTPGMVFDLDPSGIGVMLLGERGGLKAGDEVFLTGRPLDVPVGETLLGRVVNPLGIPLDGGRPLDETVRLPVERPAPALMDREPVGVPLQTGLKVVDALVPIGRGQRELILGDRQTGKTSLALDTILNQKDKGVVCAYCAIGRQSESVAKFIDDLRRHDAMEYTFVVVASGEDPPGLAFVAPYAATSMAEYFMEHGEDALIVYDDLSRHADAYRELSLLFRRPPAREAYPGDIFYVHSRLLERATRLKRERGGGSLTALPIVETEAQNIAAYIPTNLISITDGQIFLSPGLADKGVLPAVDVGLSVSRVGGKAQLPAYRAVASDLRLAYAQFEELESFSRFGARLDEHTRRVIEHGRRVREVLKQPLYQPLSVAEQTVVLLAATAGSFDALPLEAVGEAGTKVRKAVTTRLVEVCRRIQGGKPLTAEDRRSILAAAREALGPAGGVPAGGTPAGSIPAGGTG